ncbi:MAG: hypothetical protein HKN48_13410 [Flavobacteriaceae bacterium]|nr:hypothetical protein [Flavobacteriaceae bacterium]
MENNMKKIDELIKESLSQEEAEFYSKLDEQNAFEMMGGLYRGKNKWLLILMNVVMFIAMAILVYSVIQFLNAETSKGLIQWASLGFVCFGMVGMLKIFAWLQMDKNALIRELKRLELQISSLATKE